MIKIMERAFSAVVTKGHGVEHGRGDDDDDDDDDGNQREELVREDTSIMNDTPPGPLNPQTPEPRNP